MIIYIVLLAIEIKDLIYGLETLYTRIPIAILNMCTSILILVGLICYKKYNTTQFLILIHLLENYIYFGIHCLWYSFPLLSNTKKNNKIILFLFYVTIVILDTTTQSLYIQTLNSKILTAVFILLFEFYNLIEAQKIVMQAQTHIMEIMMQECKIKVYDKNLRDLTPNVLVKANVSNSSPTIYTTRQSKSNDNIQTSTNRRINIKTYKQTEVINSGDSITDQTFTTITDLIKQYLNDTHFREQLIIAKEYDYSTGQKIKYKLIISQNIPNYIVVAFIKLDEVYLAKNRLISFKQQLAQIFTHKLKTPLNATLGYLNSALNDPTVCDKSKDIYIKPATLNSKLQLYQIQDLLDYLNHDATQMTVCITKVNLVKLLTSVNESLEQQCKLKEVTLSIYINGKNWRNMDQQIYTDSQKLERVLLNLLNNSYRYAPLNSKVIVDIEIDEQEQKAFFNISDQGEGFTEDQIKFINAQALIQNKVQLVHHHDKYVHFKKNIKFGLSLQITNKLIYALSDQHSSLQLRNTQTGANFEFYISTKKFNGFLSSQNSIQQQQPKFNKQHLQSIEQNGSIYSNCSSVLGEPSPQHPLRNSISFQKPPRQQRRYPSICVSRSQGMNFIALKRQRSLCESIDLEFDQQILIVDDEPFNHDILSLILKNLGFTKFIRAFNGQECLDLITTKQHNIKFIFMDLDMPILGGIETTEVLINMMNNEKIEKIPIIGCTAHDDYETYLQCINAGMTHVIGKPVFLKNVQEMFVQLRDQQTLKIPFISQSIDRHNYII